jgi:hypothetical protein
VDPCLKCPTVAIALVIVVTVGLVDPSMKLPQWAQVALLYRSINFVN